MTHLQVFVANCCMSNFFWRRERDSNPRTREDQRFSRPPHSTTLPSLRRENTKKYYTHSIKKK